LLTYDRLLFRHEDVYHTLHKNFCKFIKDSDIKPYQISIITYSMISIIYNNPENVIFGISKIKIQ